MLSITKFLCQIPLGYDSITFGRHNKARELYNNIFTHKPVSVDIEVWQAAAKKRGRSLYILISAQIRQGCKSKQ